MGTLYPESGGCQASPWSTHVILGVPSHPRHWARKGVSEPRGEKEGMGTPQGGQGQKAGSRTRHRETQGPHGRLSRGRTGQGRLRVWLCAGGVCECVRGHGSRVTAGSPRSCLQRDVTSLPPKPRGACFSLPSPGGAEGRPPSPLPHRCVSGRGHVWSCLRFGQRRVEEARCP